MNGLKKNILFFFTLFYAVAVSFAGQCVVMSVQVREGAVRDKPTFLGKVLTRLDYGHKVDILEEKAPWARISAADPEFEGWMHISALTTKEIKLKPGVSDAETGATGNELALAGKGFDESAEKKYQEDNPTVDFSWVDKMESFVVSQPQIQAFLAEGPMFQNEAAQ